MSAEGADRVVIIVGAPGSGKTTVGRLLAERLGCSFTDVDQVIEERAGKPIAEIFADDGEAAFRRLEAKTTQDLLTQPGVVSLGGGAVGSAEIRAALTQAVQAGHRVIWLRVSATTAAKRVGLSTARPLLLGNVHGTLVRLLAERQPLYAEVATETVDADDLTPAELVEALAQPAPAR